MRRILFFAIIVILFSPSVLFAAPENQEIVIRRDWQMGGYYEQGKLVISFPIIFGDDDGPLATPEGTYQIIGKSIDYHSKKYNAPMPFSLFFTNARNAIHSRGAKFKMPAPEIRKCCRTHGCITVDHEIGAFLFERVRRGARLTIKGNRQK